MKKGGGGGGGGERAVAKGGGEEGVGEGVAVERETGRQTTTSRRGRRGRGGRGCRGRARDGAADDGVTEREARTTHIYNPRRPLSIPKKNTARIAAPSPYIRFFC